MSGEDESAGRLGVVGEDEVGEGFDSVGRHRLEMIALNVPVEFGEVLRDEGLEIGEILGSGGAGNEELREEGIGLGVVQNGVEGAQGGEGVEGGEGEGSVRRIASFENIRSGTRTRDGAQESAHHQARPQHSLGP